MKKLTTVLLLALLLSPAAVLAQEWRTEPISQIDRQFMADQRTTIDELARRHLSLQVTGTRTDLDLLQQLLDRGLVRNDDTETLQAMGIIFGDLLEKEHNLEWIIYFDRLGRSRALAIPRTREFLYPVTMISRRAEVGSKVDVKALFDRAGEIVAEIRKKNDVLY